MFRPALLTWMLLLCAAEVSVASGAPATPAPGTRFPPTIAPPRYSRNPLRPVSEAGDAEAREAVTRLTGPLVSLLAPANHFVTGGQPGRGGVDATVAANGSGVVALWDDYGAGSNVVAWGLSRDGGMSWSRSGLYSVGGWHFGDPVVVADPDGPFFASTLFQPPGSSDGVAVTRGDPDATQGVRWRVPSVVASSNTDGLDMPWVAVNGPSGAVLCTYVRFPAAGGSRLEASRSWDGGQTWFPPLTLTPPGVQPISPRLVVGNDFEVYALFAERDSATGEEFLRGRRTTNGGSSYGQTFTIGSRPVFDNYHSGPPGFDREWLQLPLSAAVDRSNGPHRGRLYAAWNEMQDLRNDLLGTGQDRFELEPNNTGAVATPFVPGEEVRGTLTAQNDVDFYSFIGTAGQTVTLYLHPDGSSCDGYLRLFAGTSDASQRLALSHVAPRVAALSFTPPRTGTYLVRVGTWNGQIGAYRLSTGVHVPVPTDVAEDHRDVVLSWSDDHGATWSAPRRVNDSAPGFEDTWPKLVVDASGRVVVTWYDHRADPTTGIPMDVRAAVSTDGGASWTPSFALNDGPSVNWNQVLVAIYPNMGDDSGLYADGDVVHTVFSDGRDGTPGLFHARLAGGVTGVAPPAAPGEVAIASVRPASGAGEWLVRFVVPRGGPVRLAAFDSAGRRLATHDLVAPGAGTFEAPLRSSSRAPGIVFLSATQAGSRAVARAVSLR